MLLQYCSDLHFEFPDNRKWLKENPIKAAGDILLIAGDVHPMDDAFVKLPLWDQLGKQFAQVIVIPGNHEYYRGPNVNAQFPVLDVRIRENVRLVNNLVIDLGEAELVCSTLWSQIHHFQMEIKQGMADFWRIRYDGTLITIPQYNHLFEQCWNFLRPAIHQPKTKPRIVMTHHLPSNYCNAPEFAGSKLNGGFCTDLTDDIKTASVDY